MGVSPVELNCTSKAGLGINPSVVCTGPSCSIAYKPPVVVEVAIWSSIIVSGKKKWSCLATLLLVFSRRACLCFAPDITDPLNSPGARLRFGGPVIVSLSTASFLCIHLELGFGVLSAIRLVTVHSYLERSLATWLQRLLCNCLGLQHCNLLYFVRSFVL